MSARSIKIARGRCCFEQITVCRTRKPARVQASERRLLVGSGDRSGRIRTYNFPQGRITDHRINLTLYKLDEVVGGELDALVVPLRQEHQADLLAAMAEMTTRELLRVWRLILRGGLLLAVGC